MKYTILSFNSLILSGHINFFAMIKNETRRYIYLFVNLNITCYINSDRNALKLPLNSYLSAARTGEHFR